MEDLVNMAEHSGFAGVVVIQMLGSLVEGSTKFRDLP